MPSLKNVTVSSPMRTTRSSLKRSAAEAAASDEAAPAPMDEAAPAPATAASAIEPVAPTPTKPRTRSGGGGKMPFKSPNSEVKKQTAAQSLAHLFQSGSEDRDDDDDNDNGSGGNANKKAKVETAAAAIASSDDPVADLMSATSGEGGGDGNTLDMGDGHTVDVVEPAPVDATAAAPDEVAAPVDVAAPVTMTTDVANPIAATETETETETAAVPMPTIKEEPAAEKGGETVPAPIPVQQPQQQQQQHPSQPPPKNANDESYVGFASPRKKSRPSPPMVHHAIVHQQATAAAVAHQPSVHHAIAVPVLPSVLPPMPETPADKAAAEVAVADAIAEEVVAETMAINHMPATTPQRAAGASALASLSGVKSEHHPERKPLGFGNIGVPHGLPMLPPGMQQSPIAEIATSGGTVQHDYLLQNLVHATKVTSPLAVPGKGGRNYTGMPGAQPTPMSGIPGAHPAPIAPPQQTKSRKEKSLGVLCMNFMDLFKNAPPNRNNNGTVIEICQVSEHLGVKRRRIYDVINILESIDIVCRVKKNTYRWHGKDDLPRFFAELQKAGLQERANQDAAAGAVAAAASAATAAAGGTVEEQQAAHQAAAAAQQHQINSLVKTKGMAQTCQKLIQIFLVTGRVEIGLTDAAEEVLGPLSPQEEANSQRAMKTKVRRMYDIANVLQSIGILTKENVGSTSLQNKPSFRWVFHILPGDMVKYLTSKPTHTGTVTAANVVAQAAISAPIVRAPIARLAPIQMPRADDLSHVPMVLPPGMLSGALANSPVAVAAPVPASLMQPAPVAAAPTQAPIASVAVAALPPAASAVPLPTLQLGPVPAPIPAPVTVASNGTAAAPPPDAKAHDAAAPVTPEDATAAATAAAVSAAEQATVAASTAAAALAEDEQIVQV